MPLTRLFPPQRPNASPKADPKQTNEPPKQKKRTKAISGPGPRRQRSFFAVALQIGRVFHLVLDLLHTCLSGETSRRRELSKRLANAIIDGARPRGGRKYESTVVEAQSRSSPLTRLRPSRPGRTPQAVARKRQCIR